MAGLKVIIPEKEADWLTKEAKRQKLTPEEVALQAIRSYTADWKKAEAAGRRLAKKLGIKTEEDVVKVFFR